MNKNIFPICVLVLTIAILSFGCKSETKKVTPKTTKTEVVEKLERKRVKVPPFNAQNAYKHIEKQVSFGPRVPNSKPHIQTKKWIVSKFKEYGAEVIEQDFEATAYTGTVLKSTNIIAQINPEYKERIFLSAHWDCRHIADRGIKDQDKPIAGANDSGSGVGVILELARILKENPIELGVDFILFDSEDYGGDNNEYSWCLGSQYWAKNLHKEGYKPNFGINLDMVGAKDATFLKEGWSMKFAGKYVNKIWSLADKMGYSSYFVNKADGPLIDDHRFVIEFAGIPCMDIIDRRADTPSGFVKEWHTHNDNMSAIDQKTLNVIGQTMLATIYNINNNTF